ncbi:MAG: carboxypeptidase-like regulatory domain-containing protein [Dysgonamonadaceae bacterium]|jgi:hypothetical protein|nr:carboxypeptidase-like regulatory domain-containing protein [Dysgonamonadaceae bacterium]
MDFKDYIQGKRQGKEAHQLERKAMDDPFLQDAIDGYDSSGGNHLSAIEGLERKIARRGKARKLRPWIWTAAALLLLLIGTQLLRWTNPEKNIGVQVASTKQPAVPPTEKASPEPPADSIAQPEIFAAEAENIPKPEKATQAAVVADAEIQAQVAEAIDIADLAEHKAVVEERESPAKANLADTQKRISGRIVDETSEPIIGASINIKNTAGRGTITDVDGNFALLVPKEEKGTLVASFIGMESTEMPLEEYVGDITLKSSKMALNEVVVAGYGTQKKSTVTGAVTTADIEALSKSDEKSTAAGNIARVNKKALSKADTQDFVFGESQFTAYFQKNYDKKICPAQPLRIVAQFFIDANGHPGNIRIKEISCPEMETEFKRLLLGSPLWTERIRNVKLTMEL